MFSSVGRASAPSTEAVSPLQRPLVRIPPSALCCVSSPLSLSLSKKRNCLFVLIVAQDFVGRFFFHKENVLAVAISFNLLLLLLLLLLLFIIKHSQPEVYEKLSK